MLSQRADLRLAFAYPARNGLIRHAHTFERFHSLRRKVGFALLFYRLFQLHDVMDFIQKPQVNFGNVVDGLIADAAAQRLCHAENALIILHVQRTKHLFIAKLRASPPFHRMYIQFQRAHRLLQRRFKIAADAHHFAGGLHLCAQQLIRFGKFIKRPAREFYHHIIQRGLKAGKGFACHGVWNFIQPVADGNFGRNLGNRIAGCFAGQRR